MYIIHNILIFVYLLWGRDIGYLGSFFKVPKITVDDNPLISLYGIIPNSEILQIYFDNYNRLG